jgi:hypothetical protein
MLRGFFNFKARGTNIFQSFNELIYAGYQRVDIQNFFGVERIFQLFQQKAMTLG